MKDLPAVRPQQPKIEDFAVALVQNILAKVLANERRSEKQDLINVERIDRCTRMFRHAVALNYISIESGEPLIEFVANGKLTSDYNIAFTKADGMKLLGLYDRLYPAANAGDQSGPPSTSNSSPAASPVELEGESSEKIRIQSEVIKAEHILSESRDETTRERLREVIKISEARIEELEYRQKKRGVRQVYVYEHPRLLAKALNKCKFRLMIISPWIRAQVVDRDFFKLLREVLARNVNVYIGYGISDDDPRASNADRDVEQRLESLAKKHENFVFKRMGDTHAKVLICDDSFCVTGSFNWLSFKGDADRTFRDEQSTLVEQADHIDGVFNENCKRFTGPI